MRKSRRELIVRSSFQASNEAEENKSESDDEAIIDEGESSNSNNQSQSQSQIINEIEEDPITFEATLDRRITNILNDEVSREEMKVEEVVELDVSPDAAF